MSQPLPIRRNSIQQLRVMTNAILFCSRWYSCENDLAEYD